MKNLKKGILAKKLLALFLVASVSLCANVPAVATQNLPTRYSSPKSKNKYQQRNGTCGSFAITATAETSSNKKGLLKKNNYFSEQHLLCYCSHDLSEEGHHIFDKVGGLIPVLAYTVSGYGPVLECDYDCYDPDNLNFSPNLLKVKPAVSVYGYKFLDKDVDSIKEAVAEYGAVAATFIVSDIINHAVSIIGWDDSKQSWLVKDSFKKPDYYIWLPYSTEFITFVCITDVRAFDDKLKRYQHDEYGVTGFYRDKNFAAANVFDFEGNEELESVMVNSSSPDAQISLHLAPVLGDGSPSNDRSTWQHLYSGYVPYDGYFTFSLQNKVQLNRGKYAIIAQMEQTADSSVPRIGCMMPYENLTLGPNTPGKSFILSGNKFCDVTSLSNCNSIYGFSIKAITRQS